MSTMSMTKRRRPTSLRSLVVATLFLSVVSTYCCPLFTSTSSSTATTTTKTVFTAALSALPSDPQSSRGVSKILVTGAAGKTGRLIVSKLERDPRYEPKALVRTERSARRLHRGCVQADLHCPLEHIWIADITSPNFVDDIAGSSSSSSSSLSSPSSKRRFNVEPGSKNSSRQQQQQQQHQPPPPPQHEQQLDAMIICTSAVPRLRKRSLVKMLLFQVPWNFLRRKPVVMDFRSLSFDWNHGGYPEKVDYQGQLAQFELARRLGIPHVILISSMGGTDPDNFLNSVGKNGQHRHHHHQNKSTKDNNDDHDDKKGGHGDILIWKRMAEKYLVEESGLDYTIIHPGGLVDAPGCLEEFVLDVDDALYNKGHMKNGMGTTTTTTNGGGPTRISREDLADLCVAALSVAKGNKVSFDCITRPLEKLNNEDQDSTTTTTTTAAKPSLAEEALGKFLELSKTANYAF